jgi:hypothetical protein
VRCEYRWMTELKRITDHPAVPVTFAFLIEGGSIARIAYYDRGRFLPDVYDPWLTYLEDHHPELRALINPMHRLDPERTRAALELIPDAFDDYAAWLATQEG